MAEVNISNPIQIRKDLKIVLEEIKGSGKTKELNEEIKSLFDNLIKTKMEVGVRVYQSNRFAFLKEGSYFTTIQGKKSDIDEEKLKQLYEKIKNIFLKIEKQIFKNNNIIDDDLDYGVYFKSANGEIHRAGMKTIPKEKIRKNSKGTLKTTQLQKYLRDLEQQEQNDISILNVHQHLSSFIGVIQATYKNGSIPNRVLSYGRLTQAFERHLQSNLLNHDWQDAPAWNYNQVWQFVKESTGNLPWYLTGDVNGTQVKYLGSGNVRLSSGSTFQDILNFFDYILNNEIDQQMIDNAYKIFVDQVQSSSDNEIKDLAHMDLVQALQTSIGDKIK